MVDGFIFRLLFDSIYFEIEVIFDAHFGSSFLTLKENAIIDVQSRKSLNRNGKTFILNIVLKKFLNFLKYP